MNAPERVFLRPIGNPLPLGFLALAGATLLVSGYSWAGSIRARARTWRWS